MTNSIPVADCFSTIQSCSWQKEGQQLWQRLGTATTTRRITDPNVTKCFLCANILNDAPGKTGVLEISLQSGWNITLPVCGSTVQKRKCINAQRQIKAEKMLQKRNAYQNWSVTLLYPTAIIKSSIGSRFTRSASREKRGIFLLNRLYPSSCRFERFKRDLLSLSLTKATFVPVCMPTFLTWSHWYLVMLRVDGLPFSTLCFGHFPIWDTTNFTPSPIVHSTPFKSRPIFTPFG